jgi:archaellum biogenesis protein FlaJ (TadC family)
MLRTFSLVGMAAQAEGRRLKAKANATARTVAFYAAAGLMGLAAFVMLHVLGWHAARNSFGPVTSALIVMLADLVIAGVLVFLASRNVKPREEMEAEAVRNVALTGAAQSAVSGFTTQAAPLMALGGIALAALWPKLRGGRRM